MTSLGVGQSTPPVGAAELGTGGRVGRAAVRLCMAAVVLGILEVLWLWRKSYDLGPVHLLVIVSGMATLLLAVSCLVGLATCLSKLLGRDRWSWVLSLLAVPLVVPIAQSLFSGGAISKVPGVLFLKIALGAALVVGVRIVIPLYQRLRAPVRGGVLTALLTVLIAVVTCALSFGDAHLQVGLYPAAHFLLAAGILCSISVLSSRVVRTPGVALRWSAVAALLSSVLLSVFSWQWAETKGLVTYSDGLLPKYRQVVVAVRGFFAATPTPGTVATATGGPADEFLFLPTTGPEIERVRAEVRNVIFILVDALRDDHVGPQRDGATLTPAMDALHQDGMRFANCYSASDHTGRSMPSVMTSLPVELIDWAAEEQAPVTSWIQHLNSVGFRTFANGIANYISIARPELPIEFCFGARKQGTLQTRAKTFVDEIIQFALEDPERPFAVYTHWMEAHIGKANKQAPRVYRGAVRLADLRLERLVSELRRVGLYDNTMIVVTADHGYALGEQNRFLGHQGCVERAIRVPLIVRLPGLADTGLSIEQNTSGHEVVPTILDCLAPNVSPLVWSRSLMALLWDPSDSRKGNQHVVTSSVRDPLMILQGRSKYIRDARTDTVLVFDLAADPEELAPINDQAIEDRLATELRLQFERQSRFVGVMLSRHRSELAPKVVAHLSLPEPQPADIDAVLKGFWQRNAATRRYIFKSILRTGVALESGALDALDALVRDSWQEDDQIFLIMRGHFGCTGATAELIRRFGEIELPARRWLVDTIPHTTKERAKQLVGPFGPELIGMVSDLPPLGSLEEEVVLLGVHNFARKLGRATPRPLRGLLPGIHRFYLNKRNKKGGAIRLLGEASEIELLRALARCVRTEDLDIVRSVAVTKRSLGFLIDVCRRVNTPEWKSFALEILARKQTSRQALSHCIERLKKFDDPEFRRQANELIQSRYSDLKAIK